MIYREANKNLILLILIPLFSVTSVTYCWTQSHHEVSQSIGINTSFGSGIFCGGISFADFNDDGWDDLSLATERGRASIFYQNDNGQFTEITLGITDTSQTKQILWVDIDNDGDKDLYTSNFDAPNRLYINDGHLNMTDVTAAFGLPIDVEPCFGAAFGDYNRDGYLDLYVVNRNNTSAITNHLYQNNRGKSFTEVNISTCTTDPFKVPFCASFLDINDNLWPDIYIASDRVGIENTLLKNLGSDKYQDISVSSNSNIAIDAMNVGLGDYDLDGDLDIYVTNTAGAGGSVLLQNDGDETFTDATISAGATWLETGWGGNFFDYDNDQDEDLYVSNGFGGADKYNAMFKNNGDGTFQLPSSNQLVGDTLPSFSNAIGDLNNDGFLDIAVSHEFGHPHQVWQNYGSVNNKWLKVDLRGIESNRDGIGSWIEVYAGSLKQVRYTATAIGYLAQNSHNVHFGLGGATMIDSVVVRWINGHVDRLYDVSANQVIQVDEFSTVTCPQSMTLTNDPIQAMVYQAVGTISTSSTITGPPKTTFITSDAVLLLPGFNITQGVIFESLNEDCVN